MNIIAFQLGAEAQMDDDENGGITDNPYNVETDPLAFADWYRGYNHKSSDASGEPERTLQEQCYGTCWAACERIAELERQSRALAADAARYRFLRDDAFLDSADCRADYAALGEKLADTHGAESDAIIDKLMSEQREEGTL